MIEVVIKLLKFLACLLEQASQLVIVLSSLRIILVNREDKFVIVVQHRRRWLLLMRVLERRFFTMLIGLVTALGLLLLHGEA